MPKIYRLQRKMRVQAPLKQCWEFFSDPSNLPRITPPELGFQAGVEANTQMYAGLVFQHRVRPLLGISLAWVTEITHVQEQRFFVDEQRFGPYRFWHHQHHFLDLGNGSTECSDIVHYALPFGIFGRVAHALFVRKQLESIFTFREVALAGFFPGPP